MWRLRVLGLVLFGYGAVMLALLFSPWKEWALNHSVASFVSATDRRVGNSIDSAVDKPISMVGDGVMMFAGLWIGVLVPGLLKKFRSTRAHSDGSGERTEPAAAQQDPRSFGHAAFDPADVEDARRGHPAVSLQPFATAMGLEYASPEIEPTFLCTLPPEFYPSTSTGNLCLWALRLQW